MMAGPYTVSQLAVIRPIIDAMAASTGALSGADATPAYIDALRVAIHAAASRDRAAVVHLHDAKHAADSSLTVVDPIARQSAIRVSRNFLVLAAFAAGYENEE